MDLHPFIRDIHDFPKKGIIYKDITPLLMDPKAFEHTINVLVSRYQDQDFTKILAIESRGFLFGAPLALRLGKGLVPVRKPGKLPAETISQSYELEYGVDTLEMHKDALEEGEKVIIIDDLLATGGTLEATANLAEKVGAEVTEIATIIELTFLKGRERLKAYPFFAPLQY